MRIDLHTHSNVSDGTDEPAALVEAAARSGLAVVALTDHDTFDGLDEAQAAGERLGVEVVRGVELSTRYGDDSVHLLGYGVDETDPALSAEMAAIRDGRERRLQIMVQRLNDLGIMITEEMVLAQAGDSPSLGRPHFADAMVAHGDVADRTEAFDRWLAEGRPGYVGRHAVDLERAIGLVRGAGGVAVVAHPWGRGRAETLPTDVLQTMITEHGLDGIEVDHQDHDQQTRAALRAFATEAGVLITGSSDYHGTGKVDHDLGCNTTDPEMFDRLQRLVGERRGQPSGPAA
ncbi:PHP domain-containing protein [Microlunatus kandeliicorticis]